jgi:hypothetical protein
MTRIFTDLFPVFYPCQSLLSVSSVFYQKCREFNITYLEQRKIQNVNFEAADRLIARGKELATALSATPIYAFEATNELWLPVRRYLHASGCATATVSAVQTNHQRQTKTRKSKNDLIDAMNIAKVFKNGESHATRMPHPTIGRLREYCRTHFFFPDKSGLRSVQLLVAMANRMHGIKFQINTGGSQMVSNGRCRRRLVWTFSVSFFLGEQIHRRQPAHLTRYQDWTANDVDNGEKLCPPYSSWKCLFPEATGQRICLRCRHL